MLILYRRTDCPRCTGIEETLKQLAVAHKVFVVDSEQDLPEEVPGGARLPVLADDGEVFEGSDAIVAHLEEVEQFKELWYKFQSDACYCDSEGGVQ